MKRALRDYTTGYFRRYTARIKAWAICHQCFVPGGLSQQRQTRRHACVRSIPAYSVRSLKSICAAALNEVANVRHRAHNKSKIEKLMKTPYSRKTAFGSTLGYITVLYLCSHTITMWSVQSSEEGQHRAATLLALQLRPVAVHMCSVGHGNTRRKM